MRLPKSSFKINCHKCVKKDFKEINVSDKVVEEEAMPTQNTMGDDFEVQQSESLIESVDFYTKNVISFDEIGFLLEEQSHFLEMKSSFNLIFNIFAILMFDAFIIYFY